MKLFFFVIVFALALAQIACSTPSDIANEDEGGFKTLWTLNVDPQGPAGKIDTAVFSPSGDWVAIGDSLGTVRIYRTSDRQLAMTVVHDAQERDHVAGEDTGREVTAIAFSPDGRLLATGINSGGGLKVWQLPDLAKGGEARLLAHLHPNATTDFARFSPAGEYLVSGANEDAIVYETDGFDHLAVIDNGDRGELNTLDFSRDGRRLALGAHIQKVRIVNVATWQILRDIPVSSKSVKSVRFSPDGRYLGVGQKDKKARVYDTATGELVADLPHGGRQTPLPGDDRGVALEAVAWSSNGQYFFTSGIVDGILRAWRVKDWQLAYSTPGQETDRAIEYIDVFAEDNGHDLVLTGGDEGAAYLLRFRGKE